jgi:CRP/FNR family transcriptional regulator
MHGLLVRDLRRTRSGLNRIATQYVTEKGGQSASEAVTMNTPYGLEMSENCVSCKLRKGHWFCSLSSGVLQPFSTASHLSTYPGAAILFVEGQMPRGAFILCSGKVKLSTTSRDGKVLIIKMAEAGEVLGLSAVISGTCY